MLAAAAAQFTLIKAAHLIDATGAPPLERGAILFEGGTIKAVGTEEAVVPPEGASVLELNYEDKTILPGLIDSHVHLIGIGDGRKGDDLVRLPDEVLTVQAAANARRHLFSGVTTVRDCGAKNRTTLMLREAVNMGITVAPRLVLSGRPIAIVGGHLSYFGIQATGPDGCRAEVRQLVKEGANFIKVTATGGSTATSHPTRPSFNVDELTAIVDEAHKFGKHVAAHCASSQGIANALDAGVDTVIHGYHRDTDGTWNFRQDLVDRMAEQHVFLNPTLHQARNRAWLLEEKAEMEGLTPEEQASLGETNSALDEKYEHVSKAIAAGVRLTAGSDAAWSYYPLGDFPPEIDAHVQAGQSTMAAIISATGDAAKSCWIDDQVGTLEPGKRGDVIVVDGDPTKDVLALRNVVDVFLGGRQVDRGNYV